MDLGKHSYLTVAERNTLLRGLAEGMRLVEVVRLVDEEHGRRIDQSTVAYYRDSEKWAEAIGQERERMAAELAHLPLSQAFIRQTMRQELIEKHRDLPTALGAVRGLLLDAAKEAGDLRDETGTAAVNLTVQLVQQVLNLPAPALRSYVETGELDPTAYLPDVLAARKLADLASTPAVDVEPLVPARITASLTGPGSPTPGLR